VALPREVARALGVGPGDTIRFGRLRGETACRRPTMVRE
jgi:hypothetical protein